MERLASLCATRKLRLTTARKTVFEVLLATQAPLSIGALIKRCPSIDRVSVYRTVELFESLSIIEPTVIGWKKRYELSGPFHPHHHHIHCESCGVTNEIHSDEFEAMVSLIAKERGYKVKSHRFEIAGLCQNCT